MTVMLVAFSMNAGAQSLQMADSGFGRITPKFAKGMVTSKIDVAADELWWGYWDGNVDVVGRLGMGQNSKAPQKYDAAFGFPAGSALTEGKTIKGIQFTFPSSENISDVRIWISNELPTSAETATVCCQKVEDIVGLERYDDYVNEVRFETPYEVDPTKDTYIGYSFVVNDDQSDEDRYPILITGKDNPSHPLGLLVKVNGDEGKWEDYEPYGFGDLGVRLLMSGDFAQDAAGIKESFSTESAVRGGTLRIPLEVQNAGVNGIRDFDLTIDIDGEIQTVNVAPIAKVEGIGTKYSFELEADAPEKTGVLPMKITVSKINGLENNYDKKVAEGKAIIVAEKADKKVVFEEFTAMWCGWCPRGLVALQEVKKDYGDKVVRVSAHINDDVQCVDYFDALVPNQPAPSAHLDRRDLSIDPYYGASLYSEVPMGVKYEIDKFLEYAPVATVKADAALDGNKLTIKSDVKFLYSGDANYGLGYVLTEDGMQDENWVQSNYYTGQNYENDPLLDPLTKMDKQITGLVYDDVAIAAKGIKNGLEGSIPATVTENQSVMHEESFDLSKYESIQDINKLGVAVFLFDRESGVIVNADFMPLSSSAAIEGVEADDELSTEVARYTVDGRMISEPEKGINLVKYSDGKVKKVIVR